MERFLTEQKGLEQCTKCTACTTACPLIGRNTLFPGPKQGGPDGERLRLRGEAFYDEALKLCMNCKRCEVACPSGVEIADMIQSARIKHEKGGLNIRNYILANTDLVGSITTMVAPLVNPIVGMKIVRRAMDLTLKIDHHRIFPKYANGTFEKWYKKECPDQSGFEKQTSYFHGCYVNYNNPLLGRELIRVLNKLGVGVQLLDKEKCCGVAMIANGFIKKAKKNAEINVDSIRKSVVDREIPVLATSSTCAMTIRDEYSGLLEMKTDDIRSGVGLATKYIYDLLKAEGVGRLKFNKKPIKIAYHTACHMEKVGWRHYSIELLKMIPNVELHILDSQCCGIAGTYGFKRENYKITQQIGSGLFSQIESLGVDYVVSDCETCKWQIEMSTSRKCLNPITVLSEALAD